MRTMDINTNEIWLCKTLYMEANANEIKSKEAYSVVIVMEPDNLNGEEFVRVQPISKQIEFRTEEDIFVEDETILGYPFIIETWNEQPILTRLLDKKLGKVQDLLVDIEEPDEYTDEQLDFRKNEIKRTAFLRQSVLSHLASEESSNKSKKPGIIRTMQLMSFAATIIGAVFLVWQPQKPTKNEFIAQYQVIKPIQLGADYQDESLRGEEVIVEGFSEEESVIIHLAIKKYVNKDFYAATTLFAKVPNLLNKNSEVCFYAALSDLYVENTLNAIKSLEDLRSIKSFNYKDDVLYYLAIGYAKEGEERKARKILNELKSLNVDYFMDKPNMIKDLRWF